MSAPSNDDRSLFTLIGELPDRVSDLVRAEIDQIKAEISYKVKHFSIGSGLIAPPPSSACSCSSRSSSRPSSRSRS